MSMLSNIAQSTTLRMIDIRPGSKIRVTDTEGGIPDFEAQVIEMKPEYGPNSMPALVLITGDGQQVIITDSGKWRVQMLVDAGVMVQDGPTEHLVLVQQRPTSKTGIRFMGGPESAVEIIKWAGGRAVIQYVQGSDTAPDALQIPTLEGTLIANVGDWIIRGVQGEFYPVKPEIFEQSYDVVAGGQEAFAHEQAGPARPQAPSGPRVEVPVGMSLAAQIAASQGGAKLDGGRFPVGTPQPTSPVPAGQPAFTGFGGQPAQPGAVGLGQPGDAGALNPLGIPQGGPSA